MSSPGTNPFAPICWRSEMISHWGKSNLTSSRGGTWESGSWQKRKYVLILDLQRDDSHLCWNMYFKTNSLGNPFPGFREGKDTKRGPFHLQKHEWSGEYQERSGCRRVRKDGGPIRTRGDFRFYLLNLLRSVPSLILARADFRIWAKLTLD